MKLSIYKVVLIALLTGILLLPKTAKACDTVPMLGSLCGFGGNFAPRGWMLADGTTLPISSNTALFSLLGTNFGGDGRTTFKLPDIRGRAIIGAGQGPGLSNYRIGDTVGSEIVALSIAQMPNHNHTATTDITIVVDMNNVTTSAKLKTNASAGDSATPAGNLIANNLSSANAYSTAAPNVSMSTAAITLSLSGSGNASLTSTVHNAGNGIAHENRMPYQAINWIIAVEGLFPSRS